MSHYGLTDEEWHDWCKDKKDYKPLIKKGWKNRTEGETEDMYRMAREYRDDHRREDIENKRIKFNTNLHTSKIFSDLKGYTGGED